jgi:hypothetical protein
MYKRLSPEDFTINAMPVIKPGGDDPGGVLVVNEDYAIEAFSVNEFGFKQLANVIKGGVGNPPFDTGNITVVIINRKNFKEGIHPSSFEINGVGVKTDLSDINHCESGREYISVNGTYYLYPDIGIAIRSTLDANFGNSVIACSEETITNSHIHVYASALEFNYSTNPSFIDNNDNLRFPTYDRFIGPYNTSKVDWINNPTTYITGIGFYNNNGDCLAVAKLPKPVRKDFQTPFSTTIEFKF